MSVDALVLLAWACQLQPGSTYNQEIDTRSKKVSKSWSLSMQPAFLASLYIFEMCKTKSARRRLLQ